MIQSRIVQIGVAPLSLVSFCHPSVLGWGRLISYINLYFFFRVPNILIFFSPVRACWGFRLWSWKITFLYLGMKDLGRGTQLNIDNTRSLIHVPQVYFRHLADRRSLHGGRIHIHTHTHTHTHTQTHTQTHTHIHTMPSFSGIKNSRMLIFEDIASYDKNFEKDWHF